MKKYRKEYKWADILAMLRNQKKEPLKCIEDFTGKLVVITGATSGIGYATAHEYASHGAEILSINRNEEKSIALCKSLKDKHNVDSSYILADYTRLEDIINAGKKLSTLDKNIDVLIHNAGTYLTKIAFTDDAIEQIFQTNYLSTFILNYFVMDKMKKQNSGRIIYVNSEAHRFAAWGLCIDDLNWEKRKYSGLKSYGQAKLAQLQSMLKFDQYFEESNITINAMHPGNVVTNSGSDNGRIYKLFKKIFVDRKARPISISSDALYYLGVSPEVKDISGKFFNLTTLEKPAPPALDLEAANELWDLSMRSSGFYE